MQEPDDIASQFETTSPQGAAAIFTTSEDEIAAIVALLGITDPLLSSMRAAPLNSLDDDSYISMPDALQKQDDAAAAHDRSVRLGELVGDRSNDKIITAESLAADGEIPLVLDATDLPTAVRKREHDAFDVDALLRAVSAAEHQHAPDTEDSLATHRVYPLDDDGNEAGRRRPFEFLTPSEAAADVAAVEATMREVDDAGGLSQSDVGKKRTRS